MNANAAKRAILALLAGLAPLAGCSRSPLTGPPELRLGREECAECGMLVSEDRFSAASLIDRDGERLYVFFDDLGCMLDYERSADAGALERYVHDHGTRGWVAAESATYLFAGPQALATPMGSGIAALADRAAADRLRAQCGGDLVGFSQAADARAEWMRARYGENAR